MVHFMWTIHCATRVARLKRAMTGEGWSWLRRQQSKGTLMASNFVMARFRRATHHGS